MAFDTNDPGPVGDPVYNQIPNDGNPILQATAGLPPFPTWPPPSGGAPVTSPELGPILNPYPYGSQQPANIAIGSPAPLPLATSFPMGMPPKNGQNQGPSYPGLPAWPPWPAVSLPDKADPFWSALH